MGDDHARLPLLLVVDSGSEPPQRRRHRAPAPPLLPLVWFRPLGHRVCVARRRLGGAVAVNFVGLDLGVGEPRFTLGRNKLLVLFFVQIVEKQGPLARYFFQWIGKIVLIF